MNPRFKYKNHIDYPELKSFTEPTGFREYYTPFGPVASVTSILSTLPHPELDAWRERLGDEEANRITEEAATIGSAMHDMLESYVNDVPRETLDTPEEKMAEEMFRCLKLMGLSRLSEIWGVEVCLYCNNLFAGRTDLVGIYNGKRSIIDYKTSIWRKKEKYLENYRHQLAAYAIAHEEMFGTGENEIEQGVILVGIRPHEKYKLGAKIQTEIMNKEELKRYKLSWMDIVEDYYGG